MITDVAAGGHSSAHLADCSHTQASYMVDAVWCLVSLLNWASISIFSEETVLKPSVGLFEASHSLLFPGCCISYLGQPGRLVGVLSCRE